MPRRIDRFVPNRRLPARVSQRPAPIGTVAHAAILQRISQLRVHRQALNSILSNPIHRDEFASIHRPNLHPSVIKQRIAAVNLAERTLLRSLATIGSGFTPNEAIRSSAQWGSGPPVPLTDPPPPWQGPGVSHGLGPIDDLGPNNDGKDFSQGGLNNFGTIGFDPWSWNLGDDASSFLGLNKSGDSDAGDGLGMEPPTPVIDPNSLPGGPMDPAEIDQSNDDLINSAPGPLGDYPTGADGGGCFTEDTLVECVGGALRPIGMLSAGDLVLARHEDTADTSLRAVTRHWVHEQKPTVRMQLESGETLHTTPAHRFFSEQRGFVSARELNSGERVLTASGQHVAVISIEPEKTLSTVYNLSVDAFQTFFVGYTRIWVHNVKDQPGAIPEDDSDDWWA
jgi:hypothetical protein